jgi:cysteine desulfurase / selenocysteine lyase
MLTAFPRIFAHAEPLRTATGTWTRPVLLNNAATSPPFDSTIEALNQFLRTYGALHRGTGPRARVTCDLVDAALLQIRDFLACRPDQHLLFTENTSAAINHLARLLRLTERDVVLTSELEHTSNYLPWRFNTRAEILEVRANDDGSLQMSDLHEKVARYGDRLRLIAISGASNLTGSLTDIPELGRVAHAAGALLFVDAAQLAAHRPICMARDGIDALAFSAHKIYAPLGLGVLALPRSLLDGVPVNPGGGSVDMISDQGPPLWSPQLDRHQSGTWNASGIVALASSCAALVAAGWPRIVSHEQQLTTYAAHALSSVVGLELHVPLESYLRDDRLGIFPFTLRGYDPFHLAAILEHEHGIEVRAGTICNHRLVRRWFRVNEDEQRQIEGEITRGNRLATYAVARASLGIHNTEEDIDRLARALDSIRAQGPALRYRPAPERECYELA